MPMYPHNTKLSRLIFGSRIGFNIFLSCLCLEQKLLPSILSKELLFSAEICIPWNVTAMYGVQIFRS